MHDFLANRKTTIRTKLLLTITGVTFISLFISITLGLIGSFIGVSHHDHIHTDYFFWTIIINIITMGIGILIAYILTLKFVNLFTKPIYNLCGLTAMLSEKQDYSVRAKIYHDDEFGLLAESFNEMLIAIEEKSKALEKAQKSEAQANMNKSNFLAVMSHEIRTPINGIIGTVDLLGETQLTGRQKNYIDIITKSAETLFDLINDILDYSKIEAGKFKLESIQCDLVQIIHDSIDMSQYSLNQKGLQMFFKNNLPSPYLIQSDPTRLKQILLNILSNAIKFTEAGSIEISLNYAQKPDNIEIIVTDTGIGIPKDKLGSIFESFTQADSTTTRKFGGTGLGLSICKHIISMMNGEISVKSEENKGASFIITLPFHYVTNLVQHQHHHKSVSSLSNKFKNYPLMLVEDSETNIMITSEMLLQNGFDVILCRNGQEAVDAYSIHKTPIILMDCFMPIKDGWQATRDIRAYEAEHNLSPTIIIALTANAMEGDREKCLNAGMSDYIPKPFKKDDLLNKLWEYVD